MASYTIKLTGQAYSNSLKGSLCKLFKLNDFNVIQMGNGHTGSGLLVEKKGARRSQVHRSLEKYFLKYGDDISIHKF